MLVIFLTKNPNLNFFFFFFLGGGGGGRGGGCWGIEGCSYVLDKLN